MISVLLASGQLSRCAGCLIVVLLLCNGGQVAIYIKFLIYIYSLHQINLIKYLVKEKPHVRFHIRDTEIYYCYLRDMAI